ncbi:hypothetical protein Vafri_12370 [Volvox africanus]|uniref:Uncharacterized protein n=1 Tax=Volvox africanus TaxID=51714 RepID=A0A8J4B9T1_9CHLO|nr:hypothetical protein Vafri_12370 [Volvox africanus]
MHYICSTLIRHPGVRTGCPSVAGYTFYNGQEVMDAFILRKVASSLTPSKLGSLCAATQFCNGFDTSGTLLLVPIAPVFTSTWDSLGGRVQTCAGTYHCSTRTLSGLVLPVRMSKTKWVHNVPANYRLG